MSKNAERSLFGPAPSAEPKVKPQNPTLSPSNLWPFQPIGSAKKLTGWPKPNNPGRAKS
jgi:hypothetical protein